MTEKQEALRDKANTIRHEPHYGSIWNEMPEYPVKDWQYEVANGGTRLGYWDWVENCIEHLDEEET